MKQFLRPPMSRYSQPRGVFEPRQMPTYRSNLIFRPDSHCGSTAATPANSGRLAWRGLGASRNPRAREFTLLY